MKYYPIMIPTMNRYTHFRRCVESLARNTYADKTELVIGLDYPPSDKYREGYELIKSYIPTISGFAKVTVFEQDHNIGATENWRLCERYCEEKYDAYLCTEDDNEFSPCFLDFMFRALEKYKNDESVLSISGYSQREFYDLAPYNCFLIESCSAWGLARWTHKVKFLRRLRSSNSYCKEKMSSFRNFISHAKRYPGRTMILLDMLIKGLSYGDAIIGAYYFFEKKYELRPCVSLVRNWGNDGSGIHCGGTPDDDIFSKQVISNNLKFDDEFVVSPITEDVYDRFKKSNMPANVIRRIYYYFRLYRLYFIFRCTKSEKNK